MVLGLSTIRAFKITLKNIKIIEKNLTNMSKTALSLVDSKKIWNPSSNQNKMEKVDGTINVLPVILITCLT